MIERIVLFKLKDEYCNDASRTEFANRAARGLRDARRRRPRGRKVCSRRASRRTHGWTSRQKAHMKLYEAYMKPI